MDHLASATLGSVAWLVARPGGGVVASTASGGTAVGALAPDVAAARAASARLAAPVPALWTPESGRPVPMQVLAIPGLDGVLGLPESAFDAQVGGAIENLVNQIAHDVRNHAFAIGLQAELGERRSTSPDVKGHFAAVLRQIDALKCFLERLLLFGRPARLEPGEVALEPLARSAVRRLQYAREPAAAPISVTIAVDEAVGSVRWDAAAIDRVLDALLDNAVRSAEPAPAVRVEAAREGEFVRLTVADRGPGIRPQDLPKLSVPMLLRRPGGAGLGLAIARKLVAAHGGTLEIASSNAGTSVTLRIPPEAPTA